MKESDRRGNVNRTNGMHCFQVKFVRIERIINNSVENRIPILRNPKDCQCCYVVKKIKSTYLLRKEEELGDLDIFSMLSRELYTRSAQTDHIGSRNQSTGHPYGVITIA